MSKFRHLFAAHVTAEMRDAANELARNQGLSGAVYSVPLFRSDGGDASHFGLLSRMTDDFLIEVYLGSGIAPPSWATPEQIIAAEERLAGVPAEYLTAIMQAITFRTVVIAETDISGSVLFDQLCFDTGLVLGSAGD